MAATMADFLSLEAAECLEKTWTDKTGMSLELSPRPTGFNLRQARHKFLSNQLLTLPKIGMIFHCTR